MLVILEELMEASAERHFWVGILRFFKKSVPVVIISGVMSARICIFEFKSFQLANKRIIFEKKNKFDSVTSL